MLVVVQGIHDSADVFSNCILSEIFIEGLLNDRAKAIHLVLFFLECPL